MEALFINNNKTIKRLIDFDFLEDSYKNGLLKGANVFARLLGLYNDDKFEKIKFGNNMELFLNYGIKCNQWDNLILFLKFGQINDNYLEELINTSIILGGIPSLDKYYQEHIDYEKKLKSELDDYNPMNPGEDIKNKYIWITLGSEHGSQDKHIKISNDGFSYCSREGVIDKIYRKLKE
jgi:hypothetical protein